MARPDPTSILITGATGGIGMALARAYAGPGIVLGLTGRDGAKLEAISAECRDKGATVVAATVDIRDRPGLHAWLADLDARHPLDLAIANAGVTGGLGPGRSRESDADAERQAEINYKGVVNTVSGIVEPMRARGRGQIALVSSLAGIMALPDMPSYSASKAAVVAYGDSLRGWLKPFGIHVTIICPGFVTSPMSARHQGAKPFEISAEKAATIIQKGLRGRRAMVAFPLPLVVGITLNKMLPRKIGDLFMGGFSAEIEPDGRKD
ncbi:SDR family NAD(P)-dependent oxidoreductase [Rhodobium gokarnense]|uniref:Short-subunit dehydrogenase n=1 Tax=Rhodobium gokarnense TaxID=364296 RepID=A0ABT3HA80_9HYPH|nr:SDR family NAD(P)-dependent oxidoreductase [Rhodobium gokarnense]MCW2307311.1 short-subunit dehydrogenase [Rhodobium gokarnense]